MPDKKKIVKLAIKIFFIVILDLNQVDKIIRNLVQNYRFFLPSCFTISVFIVSLKSYSPD